MVKAKIYFVKENSFHENSDLLLNIILTWQQVSRLNKELLDKRSLVS
jgi:hypothetical protein